MSHKVIDIMYGGQRVAYKVAIIEKCHQWLPVGSILQDAVIVTDLQGNEYWEGIHSSMAGSYIETVPVKYCEIWDEEKHDPSMWAIKKHLEEKARQERLSPVLSHMASQLTKE